MWILNLFSFIAFPTFSEFVILLILLFLFWKNRFRTASGNPDQLGGLNGTLTVRVGFESGTSFGPRPNVALVWWVWAIQTPSFWFPFKQLKPQTESAHTLNLVWFPTAAVGASLARRGSSVQLELAKAMPGCTLGQTQISSVTRRGWPSPSQRGHNEVSRGDGVSQVGRAWAKLSLARWPSWLESASSRLEQGHWASLV